MFPERIVEKDIAIKNRMLLREGDMTSWYL